ARPEVRTGRRCRQAGVPGAAPGPGRLCPGPDGPGRSTVSGDGYVLLLSFARRLAIMSAIAKLIDPPTKNIPTAIPVGILVSYSGGKSRSRTKVRSRRSTATAPVYGTADIWSELDAAPAQPTPERRQPKRNNGLALMAATLCGSLLTAGLCVGG